MAVRSCLGSFLVRFVSLSLSFAVESQRAAFESVFTISDLTLFRCVCFNDSFFHADERVSKRSGVPRLLKRITRKPVRKHGSHLRARLAAANRTRRTRRCRRENGRSAPSPLHTHTHTHALAIPSQFSPRKLRRPEELDVGPPFIFSACACYVHTARLLRPRHIKRFFSSFFKF